MNDDAPVVDDNEVAPIEDAEAETLEATEEVQNEEQVSQPDEPSESSPEKKDAVQKRIDELTRKMRDQEREAAYWRERAKNPEPEPQAPQPDKSLADFDYDEGQYSKYLLDFAQNAAKSEVQQKIQRERVHRAKADFESKESQFAESVDDYQEVTRNPNLAVTDYMVAALQASTKGPEVLYYLGKNPEVSSKLAAMHPIAMAQEIGRIEATKLVKPEPKLSNAPPPPPKLEGVEKSTTVKIGTPEADELSTDEWMKRRFKQVSR